MLATNIMRWFWNILIRYRIWRERDKPLPTPYPSYEQTLGRIKRKPMGVDIIEYPIGSSTKPINSLEEAHALIKQRCPAIFDPDSKRSFNLKKVRDGVYAGNIDVRTPSDERFFIEEDRVEVMRKLIKKNKKNG